LDNHGWTYRLDGALVHARDAESDPDYRTYDEDTDAVSGCRPRPLKLATRAGSAGALAGCRRPGNPLR